MGSGWSFKIPLKLSSKHSIGWDPEKAMRHYPHNNN